MKRVEQGRRRTPKTKASARAGGTRRTGAKAPAKKAAKARPAREATANARAPGQPAARLIDERIRELAGWRGATLARMRALILEADPEIVEEWKWSTPVWSHDGIVCTGEAYKKAVKLTFARGAALPDPTHLFNSSLGGNVRRAIDIHEEEQLDAPAFKALVKAAVAKNVAARTSKPSKSAAKRVSRAKVGRAPVLLSGGNPQIAKADGDAPVQAPASTRTCAMSTCARARSTRRRWPRG